MKTYNTYKIGTAALAAVLVLGIDSCAHHRKKSAAPPAPAASVSQPKPQATVLEAPKSLEGAWIKVKAHGKGEPVGSQTYWWYIKNGKSHHYWEGDIPEGHPATPAYFKKPDYTGRWLPICEDSLGRGYNMGTISYQPRGKTATLKIEDFDRYDPTLCRSVSIEDDFITGVSEESAEITFTSIHSGVYHGTIKGVFARATGPSGWFWELDSITIYTE